MKKSIKTKVLSLVASFAMVLSLLVLPIGVHAEGEGPVAKIDKQEYNTLQEALDDAKDGNLVTLLKNVSFDDSLWGFTIDEKSITVDLNKYTISGNASKGIFRVNASGCEKNVIVQNGTVINNSNTDISLFILANQNGGSITLKNIDYTSSKSSLAEGIRIGNAGISPKKAFIENCNINTKKNGILIFGADNQITELDIIGGQIHSDEFALVGNGTRDNTDITITGTDIVTTKSVAIYHPQVGNLTINEGTKVTSLIGGIQFCGSGILTINGGKIISTSQYTPFPSKPGEQSDGSTDDGAAISLISRGGGYQDEGSKINFVMNGGILESTNNAAVSVYRLQQVNKEWVTNDKTSVNNYLGILSIKNGELFANPQKGILEIDKKAETESDICISGGYYNCLLQKDYIENDKVCVEVDGKYIVHSHENLTKVDDKEPTCTENGNIAHYSCDVCGKLFNLIDKTEMTQEATIVKAKGHTSDNGTVTKKPTVDAEGVKTYKCSVCGEVLKTESIAKLPMPKPEEPKLPSIDTSKPVDKVTVGVNDEKSSEVLETVTNNIVKDIIDGKDVKDVATLLVDESKVEEILTDAKEVKTEVKVENKTEKDIDKKIIDTIDTKVESTMTKNQTFEVAQYLDLSVLLTVDGQSLAQVNELDKPIQFTVKLPTDLLKANREFVVVRVHNGVATLIEPSSVTKDGVLTFETDEFSTYAIAYVDTKTTNDTVVTPEQPKPTDKEDKPVDTNKPTQKDETVKTDDENNMTLYASFAGLALVGVAILVLTKKREEFMK